MHGLKEATRENRRGTPIVAVDANNLARVARKFGDATTRWLETLRFNAEPGKFVMLPDDAGGVRAVLVGVQRKNDIYALSALPQSLPVGEYHLAATGIVLDPVAAAISWGLGAYRFTRYRKAPREVAQLVTDKAVAKDALPMIEAIARVRDLINTPTEDLGPEQMSDELRQLAKTHGAKFREFVGEDLLKENFPTIYAVGRASHRAPRLIELRWGNEKHPRVSIIGKGVCFDTGGLDMKSSDGMRWMKKDMGGAAHAIALAGLIMQAKLPIHLQLLVPAVENAISANSYRPGEVLRTRAGITVEVDNTDAEGRLVLCDAISYSLDSQPELIVDFATLTGAARVALGPELPALFSNDEKLASETLDLSLREHDPMWRLPLWLPYLGMLDSRVADTVNAGSSRLAGAITAALFLQRFLPPNLPWIHLDTYAWNDADRPGRPAGGEAQGLRTVFALLRTRYASRQGRSTRKAK